MKTVLTLLTSLVFLSLAACKQPQQVRAKIFERQEVDSNKLMIKYSYIVKDRTYVDSLTTQNRIIDSEHIYITIDPSNPQKGIPAFK
jgi:hypothetical protein